MTLRFALHRDDIIAALVVILAVIGTTATLRLGL